MSCNCRCSCNEERLAIGDVLYGFCGGSFGRDSYYDKTIEHIGRDWVVVRNESGNPEFYRGNPQRLVQYKTPEEYQ